MQILKLGTCLALVVIASLVSACGQKRVMTLPAAPSDLFDPSAPIEVKGSEVVAKRHGDVIAGAGEGAGKGMLAGAGNSILAGASTGNPAGLALGIFLSPVFAVGGGIYGAAAAHPADETNAAVAAIERVYADQKLLGALTSDVENQIHSLGFPAPQACNANPEDGSTSPSDTEGCSPAPANRLRMTVNYAFVTRGAYSPDLGFGIDVEATAANADRTREGRAFRWVYLSPQLDFFTATENEAEALRSAIADAQRRLAGRIVDDLLVARREERVSGTYSPNSDGFNFRPHAMAPGVAVRVPTKSQLINVPETSLSEAAAATPLSPADSRPNEPGDRRATSQANETASDQKPAPFYCSTVPLPNSIDECRAAIDGH